VYSKFWQFFIFYTFVISVSEVYAASLQSVHVLGRILGDLGFLGCAIYIFRQVTRPSPFYKDSLEGFYDKPWPCFLLKLFLVLLSACITPLLVIRTLSLQKEVKFEGFPPACEPEVMLGCTRISENTCNRAFNMS